MEEFSQRTISLIGKQNYQKLKNSAIPIVGVGGVGGFVAEFLARAGVGNIAIVDGDKVEQSNINRQIIATQHSVGKHKVNVLAERLLSINPQLNINTFAKRFNSETKDEIFTHRYDFVIDAIDSIKDKTELIVEVKKQNLQIISAMGAGNRYDTPVFEVKDIYKTTNDGLAKIMRKNLRQAGVKDVPCVCAKSIAVNSDGVIGSISYYPAACACVIASFVVNKIIL